MFSRNLVKLSISIILVLFSGSMLIIHSIEFQLNSGIENKNKLLIPSRSQNYVLHAPILITSDGGFGSYNFSGAGTRGDPYLIEGYNITSYGAFSMGIAIRDTTVFFVITECIIYTDYTGVDLNRVASSRSKIIGNRIISLIGDGGGINLRNVQNCTVSDNICNNFMQGIHLDEADDCIIYNNYFYDINYQGINIRYSDSNSITYNRIRNTREHAIALVGPSSNNLIHNNILDGNTWSDSYNIDGTQFDVSPTSQGYDEGSNNVWYDSESQDGNTWSDYFGFGSYQIDGPANAVDLYPKHTTGFTLFNIIISASSITIGLVTMLLVYRFYRRRKIT